MTVRIKQYLLQELPLFLILTCCIGIVLSGCSRFEFNQTKSNTEKNLKHSTSKEKVCVVEDNSTPTTLVDRLDATLMQMKESKTWAKSTSDACKKELPYRFTVISVAPIVAMGVPDNRQVNSHCVQNSAAINCLRSKRFTGYYQVDNKFMHATNLVWFSPEHGPRLFEIPAQAKSMFMMIGGQSIRLKRKDNWWSFAKKG